MTMQQDSNDPTGVAGKAAGNGKNGEIVAGNAVSRARNRKANAAIQMKLAGATWPEIAMVVGYPTPRAALVAVEKALEREMKEHGDREAMRKLAGARLNRLLRGVWAKAIDDKHPEQMVAVTKAREIIAQESKLFGLDAPTEVVVHNPTQQEIEAWVVQITAHSEPPVQEANILEADEQEDGSYAVASG